MIRLTTIASAAAFLLASGASAQQTVADYQQRQADLVALSVIFGELHHIRRSCEPRYEADIWRERMKELVELEEPQPTARNEMVAAFNKAYRRAQNRFSFCDRQARDYAAARANTGERIVERLAEPLRETMMEEDGPFVWTGTANGADLPD